MTRFFVLGITHGSSLSRTKMCETKAEALSLAEEMSAQTFWETEDGSILMDSRVQEYKAGLYIL